MITPLNHNHGSGDICPYCDKCEECFGSGWIGCCENTGRSCKECKATGFIHVGLSSGLLAKLDGENLVEIIKNGKDGDISVDFSINYYIGPFDNRPRFEIIKFATDSALVTLKKHNFKIINIHQNHIIVTGKISDIVSAACLFNVRSVRLVKISSIIGED